MFTILARAWLTSCESDGKARVSTCCDLAEILDFLLVITLAGFIWQLVNCGSAHRENLR